MKVILAQPGWFVACGVGRLSPIGAWEVDEKNGELNPMVRDDFGLKRVKVEECDGIFAPNEAYDYEEARNGAPPDNDRDWEPVLSAADETNSWYLWRSPKWIKR